jgi:peptide/nickel transport system ATP-binding protein
MTDNETQSPLLDVQNLSKHYDQQAGFTDWLFRRDADPIKAVDGVSFELSTEETVGVIGESGCGKTTLVETLIGLYEPTDGTVRFKSEDTSTFDRGDWKRFRRNVRMIFQDPFNSLDPKWTIEESLKEPLKIHGIGDRDRRVREVLKQVELSPPEKYLDRYPRHLSGGEKQRVSIARALIVEPDLILADEPVSMLDVSTQAAILKLLSNLAKDLGLSVVYISHDLSTVSYVCDKVLVMYRGAVVESAPTRSVLTDPKHPYTQALISAIPVPDSESDRERTELGGTVREPVGVGEGCRFRDRCPERMDICEQTPVLYPVEDGHQAKCHLYYDHEEYLEGNPASSLEDTFEDVADSKSGPTTPDGGEQP